MSSVILRVVAGFFYNEIRMQQHKLTEEEQKLQHKCNFTLLFFFPAEKKRMEVINSINMV